MDEQNPWWRGEKDPHVERWNGSPLKWVPPLMEKIDTGHNALHFLIGPRQVGKTTLVKLMVERELGNRDPFSIFYFSCDELLDHSELGEIIDSYIGLRREKGIKRSMILLDEITFVDQWWRALKFRLDRGILANDTIIVTGSASMDLMGHVDTFPGRRGSGVDHIMLPLSFSEYSSCIGGIQTKVGGLDDLPGTMANNVANSDGLKVLWDRYLRTGGFPRPIIDHHTGGKESDITKRAFMDWMKGDWSKTGKRDTYMKEVIRYIFRARGTPVSWNSISTETSINSPHTAKAYVEVLKDIFTVKVLDLISADGKVNYRKNRKIHLTDPFIYRVLSEHVNQEVDPGWLVEGTSASLIGRGREAYYFRNGTEADVVVLQNKNQIGFEITKGVKSWRRPWHLRSAYLIDRDNIHLFMASL